MPYSLHTISNWAASFWFVFLFYWTLRAFGNKRNLTGVNWMSHVLVRLALLVAAILYLRYYKINFHQIDFYNISPLIPNVKAAQVIGLALLGIGTITAIWARTVLGKNWSGHPTIKEGHELVTTGPYSLVRHPIYTGLLLAALGTVLAYGVSWPTLILLLAVILFLAGRIIQEEKLMLRQFPQSYQEYRKRSKIIIPFIL